MVSLRLLVSEADYVRSVLEESMQEVVEAGTFTPLLESVAKSRRRNKEKVVVGCLLIFTLILCI